MKHASMCTVVVWSSPDPDVGIVARVTVVKRLSEGREHVTVTVDPAQVRALFDEWLSELENAGTR